MISGCSNRTKLRLVLWVFMANAGVPPASAQGLLIEPDSRYRSFPIAPVFRAFLPAEADLSAYFPPPGFQGPQGSCTAWAVGYALRSYYEGRRQGWDVRAPEHQVSPASIYDQILAKHDDCDAGSTISDALDLLKVRGAMPLSEMPYDPASCSLVPGRVDDRWRISDWMRVDHDRLDDVKGAIAQGNPVVFGMNTSKSFSKLQASAIYNAMDEERDYGHAMVAVGYSDSRQAIKVINSWGPEWAEKGFGWISYQAFSRFTDRAFTMRVPGAALPIPAPPSPTPAPPTPAPPPPAPSVGKAEAQRLASQLSCASVSFQPESGPLQRVSGFVGTVQDRNAVMRAAGEGVAADALQVRPWPQCEALQTFNDALKMPQGLGLRVIGSHPEILQAGDHLVLRITTPAFPSYLYVTYLQSGGDAVHLMQPQGAVFKAFAPGSTVTLGLPPGPVFRIAPPLGPEMIVAVASASPLFKGARPGAEIERDYLTAFRVALLQTSQPGMPPRTVAAAVAALTTTQAP